MARKSTGRWVLPSLFTVPSPGQRLTIINFISSGQERLIHGLRVVGMANSCGVRSMTSLLRTDSCSGGPGVAGELLDRFTLRLRACEFDEIISGTRTDFRLPINRLWAMELTGKVYKHLVLKRGFPATGQIVIPWPGYTVELIRAPNGPSVVVFKIDVSGVVASRRNAHAVADRRARPKQRRVSPWTDGGGGS